ncbi:MAG: large subunit ribosomal protein [Patescibacteria group bacterium]|nr:large subunit ribosomal protein [Patescibacteria group bacterium]
MEITAFTKQARISPRKVRLVADTVRSMPLDQALDSLKVIRKRGASILHKTLESAVANAVNNKNIDKATLQILKIEVTDGPAMKRYHASTRGRIHPYKRRSSNVRIVLTQKGAK